jgi:hypothetical protein
MISTIAQTMVFIKKNNNGFICDSIAKNYFTELTLKPWIVTIKND